MQKSADTLCNTMKPRDPMHSLLLHIK